MAGYRPPYTSVEEKKLLRYIIDNQLHYTLRGDAVWKDIEQAKIVDRTWQSLKQHFRKKLIYQLYLPSYGLTHEEQNDLRLAYADTKRNPPQRHETKESSESETEEGSEKKGSNNGQNVRKKVFKEPDFFTMKWSDSEEDS